MSSENVEGDEATKATEEGPVEEPPAKEVIEEEKPEEAKIEDHGDVAAGTTDEIQVVPESKVEEVQPVEEVPEVLSVQEEETVVESQPEPEMKTIEMEDLLTEQTMDMSEMQEDVEEGSGYTFHGDEQAYQREHSSSKTSIKSAVSKLTRDHKSELSQIIGEEDEMFPLIDDNRESMFTQAGSYKSTSSSSLITSEDETLPKNFQDYVKRYSSLFGRISGKEETLCDEEAGKTFLKIDLNEIISGYKTEDKLCRDTKSSLVGMTRVRQDLVCIENESIVLRKDYKMFKGVRILSGGHMGNEPLYIDYVGKGMLTGVVLGTVSEPPSVASVTKAMRELAKGSPGLLIIIQNNVEYRLIFGLAMERLRMEGFTDIDMVTVGDDCFERCKSPAGRRGLSGIILLYKLAGSMADSLKTLREIFIATRTASKSIVTISCMTKPFKAIGTGIDKSSKDGIHFNGDNCQMIKRMIDYCIHPLKYFSMRLEPEDSVIVLINSYRTKTPGFYIIVDYIMKELEKREVKCGRVYADNFVTGFWPGFSLTLLLDCNNRRVQFMDAPCNCSLWPRSPSDGFIRSVVLESYEQTTFAEMGPMLTKLETSVVKHAVITACKAIILCENLLNSMHFFGNYGTKLRMGAEAILQATRQFALNFDRPFNLMIGISEILVEKLPGVMGAMYGCLFEGAARSFVRSPLTTLTAENWSEAMDEALKTLRAYTNAKGGIVSLALSLIPVVSAIHGPYIRLPQNTNRNPILSALDSLRFDIEERVKQSSDEKESLLKNQLDVESYALIIWLHAIYSSIYWKVPSEISIGTLEDTTPTVSDEKIPSKKSTPSQSSKSKLKSARMSSIKGINRSLEFISANDKLRISQMSGKANKSSQLSETNQSGKIFT